MSISSGGKRYRQKLIDSGQSEPDKNDPPDPTAIDKGRARYEERPGPGLYGDSAA